MNRKIAVGFATIALGCVVSNTARAQDDAAAQPPSPAQAQSPCAAPAPPAQPPCPAPQTTVTQGQAEAPAQEVWTAPPQTTTTETTKSYARAALGAPRQAFEIGVSGGYTQGFGSISGGVGVHNIGNAGFGIGGELAYRATPMFSIGIDGQYQTINPNNDLAFGTHVNGMTAGINATFHGMPYHAIDPYLSLGTGYRMLWEAPPGVNNNLMTHGFELGKLQVGLDWRVNRDVAIGPVIGADLNMFVWQTGPAGTLNIPNKRVNTFLFAGFGGRFDLGGARDVAPVQQVGMR